MRKWRNTSVRNRRCRLKPSDPDGQTRRQAKCSCDRQQANVLQQQKEPELFIRSEIKSRLCLSNASAVQEETRATRIVLFLLILVSQHSLQVLLICFIRLISGFKCFPVPFRRFVQVCLHTISQIVTISHCKYRVHDSLLRREGIVFLCLAVIPFYPVSLFIMETQIKPGAGIPLISGNLIILNGFRGILFYADPFLITPAQRGDGVCISLFRGHHQILHALFFILSGAGPGEIT